MIDSKTEENASRLIKRTAMMTVAVAIGVLGIKYLSYVLTGSVALLSDALESVVNVVAGLVALWAISVSYKPADNDHPFGHTKAEYFSAVIEGVLIAGAAVLILIEAWGAFREPRTLETPLLGLIVNGIATAINLGWASYLIKLGRQHRSPAFAADGRHLMTDVVTSIGVILGLAIATATQIPVLDPLLAALVALNILREGFKVISSSLSGLMDQAIEPEDEARVREIVSQNAEGAIEVHELKTRISGRMIFIEFHLVVPGAMSVRDSHVICDRIENALAAIYETARIQIHVEPEDEAQSTGVPVL